MNIQTWKVIDAGDIGDEAGQIIGKPINGLDAIAVSFDETNNGGTYPITVPYVPDKWDQDEYDKEVAAIQALKDFEPDMSLPEWKQWQGKPTPGIRALVNVLHEHGKLPAGDYYIECYW